MSRSRPLGLAVLMAALVLGPAVAVAQSDAPAPPLSSPTAAKTVQLAIAEIAKLPLPALPPLNVLYQDDLDAMGAQSGDTIYMNPTVPYWEQVAVALHEIGHALHIEGHLDITPVLHEMRRTPTVQALFVDAQAGDTWCQYAMEPTELFARGFAQWVATRSGNEHILAGVDAFGRGQWEPTEFQALVPSFEALFGV